MTLDESNAPARVLKRAEAIGVNAACRGAGISQTLFYRWRLAFSGTDPMACTRGLGVPRLEPVPQLLPAVERRVPAAPAC